MCHYKWDLNMAKDFMGTFSLSNIFPISFFTIHHASYFVQLKLARFGF